ncbi:hypothetical protein Ae201684P_020648 [Aphanomyces euteiches]|nr:hypothetical protein Ae201684P_020648 [Aphanomyces euteiches]
MSLCICLRAHSCGVDGGWVCDHCIGLALQRKFQSKTPAAVKRDPPKVVGPRPAVNPPNVVDFHMLLVVQLLAVLFTRQWRYGSGCPVLDDACQRSNNHARSTSVQGSSSRLGIDQASNDASALEGATPLAPMDDVQVVNLLLR